jgi:transcriptional regulator with XRE-family HTH domain
METLGEIIHKEREKRGLLLRHVGAALDIDQALVSKYERGERLPTKEQVVRLAKYYALNENDLMAAWLADKILIELRNEKMALRAMKLVEEKIKSFKK